MILRQGLPPWLVPGQGALPLLLPGIAVAAVVGVVVRRPLARALRIRPAVAFVLVVSVGVIVSATLTPLRSAFGDQEPEAAGCDLSRLGPPSVAEILEIYDAALNILIFVPLGAIIASAPSSRPRTVLAVGAVALPFAIEMTQLLVPALHRACQSADVIDNLIGLGGGLAVGFFVRRRTVGGSRPA